MSEKQFELAYEQGNWWAVRDGDITLWKEEVVYLLNALAEENRELRKDINIYKYESKLTIQFLQDENEQLRKQCFELEKDYLIETSDISDKHYLEEELSELKKEYGVIDDESD